MIRAFNRFELKYVITAATRDALQAEMAPRMRPDEEGEHGVYRISSLYYDSPDFACYRSKIEGIKFRRKVRIRLYGDYSATPNPLAMVEIKQRINRTTQKRRLALPLDESYLLCRGELDQPFADDFDADVASEVTYLARSLRLRPSCIISYQRQAFVGNRFEPGLRITFDVRLRTAVPHGGLHEPGTPHTFLAPPLLVMEVKTNNALPLWVSRMLARHNCTLVRFSKYAAGLLHVAKLRHRAF